MGRSRELPTETRSQIVLLRAEGYSMREIARRFRISVGTVSKTINRVLGTQSFASRPRSGRPRSTTNRTDNIIHRMAVVNPSVSSKGIRAEMAEMGLRPPSYRTISRRLREKYHLPCRRPARKPLLTSIQRKKRLNWARAHQHWTMEMWKSVLFSDETSISQFRT